MDAGRALADRLGSVPGTWEKQLERGWGTGSPHAPSPSLLSPAFTAIKHVANALACARPFPKIISL